MREVEQLVTTIACSLKHKSMAADSRITGDIIHHANKMARAGESIFGVAGDYDACTQFLNWKLNGGEKPEITEESFEAVELTRSGIFIYQKSLIRLPVLDRIYASGAGAQGAMVAMHLGYTPREAVIAVAKFCETTGAPFKELSLAHATR